MSAVRISVGKVEILAEPLVSGRAVAVTHVVLRGSRVWAKNAAGRVYCNDANELRRRSSHTNTLVCLREEDIVALGLLGLIDAKIAKKLKADEEYRRDYAHKLEWLAGDADTLREAGVTLPRGFKAKLEAAAHRYAKERQAKRRKSAREAKARAKATAA